MGGGGFQLQWLDRFKWLAYSAFAKGAFCKTCVLFANKAGSGKGSHEKLRSLVSTPFSKWKDAIEIFNNHSATQYHKGAVIRAQDFISVREGKKDSIHLMINKKAKEELEQNRAKLRTIIETLILCGRQDIALRGDNSSGSLTINEPEKNDGNFRALLRYRARGGDEALVHHIKNPIGNALYTSPTIQNEIISIIGKHIQDQIVSKVRLAQFFSVLADETTDVANTEQFSLCIRYFDQEAKQIREDFLKFVEVRDVTGRGLASVLKRELQELGLDLQKMKGQGYDGASSMSGKFNGMQAVIKAEFPTAIYTHCSSHCLNLCLSDASKVQGIRNALGVLNDICAFFRISPKRMAALKEILQLSSHSFTRLSRYCETRWVERHEAVTIFCDAIPQIVQALEKIIENGKDEKGVATSLHYRLCSFDFLINIAICEKLLGITYNLSVFLQTVNIDLNLAVEYIDSVIFKLKNIRNNADFEFENIFHKTAEKARNFGVMPSTPRRIGTQRHRENHPASTPEEYYRRSVFIPYLDEVLKSLEERFLKHRSILKGLNYLIPKYSSNENTQEIQNIFHFYTNDLKHSNLSVLTSEFELWSLRWKNTPQERRPQNAVDAIIECNEDLFPNINILLRILATLPVTTASAERSFSTLKRVKTYLRNRTGQERLTGLALMSIHRSSIDIDKIIENFMLQPRRIKL